MPDESAQKPRPGEWAAKATRPKGADLSESAARLSRQNYNQPLVPEQTLETLALEMGLEYLKSLTIDMIDFEAVEKISFETASKYRIIAMSCNEERKEIKVAINDPANIQITDEIAMTTGFNNITLIVTSEEDIKACIQHFYDKTAGEIQELVELNESKPEEKNLV